MYGFLVPSARMIPSLVLFIAVLVLSAVSPNRHIRHRLLVSGIAFGTYAALAAAIRYHVLTADMQQQVVTIQPLLLVFGAINGLVAAIINPWQVNRLPDRFPTIVQDAIVIGLFALGATMVLQEKIFAATAVGAVVVGFALQDTLGNLFAGLAIQIEKPFRIGQWVRIAETDGLVSEITWRAVKVRTKSGNFVVVPNSKLSGDIIINYSEPTPETRIEVEVGVSYDNPPNLVKRVIVEALKDERNLLAIRAPEVLMDKFDNSAINYRIRVWTTEFDADERIRDRIRVALYYAFKRNAIDIPYPIQMELQKEVLPAAPRDYADEERTLRKVSVFGSLSDEEKGQLARATTRGLFGSGELIVKQGESGSSMFVVASGEVVVLLEPQGHEVARMGPGGFFGEMSLLTGAPRNATVRTTIDSELLEITGAAFRQFVLANPAVVEQIGVAVANRRAELEERRATGAAAAQIEPPHTLIDRIRRYLHLNL
jgi:small-conductance mechanosensitive channel/CRP-like cAMP-binding protein